MARVRGVARRVKRLKGSKGAERRLHIAVAWPACGWEGQTEETEETEETEVDNLGFDVKLLAEYCEARKP